MVKNLAISMRPLRAFLGRAVNDNWNGQLNPLAPPHL